MPFLEFAIVSAIYVVSLPVLLSMGDGTVLCIMILEFLICYALLFVYIP